MLVLKWDSCRIHGLKITSKPRMGFLCLIHGLRGIGEEARGLAREKVLLWHRRPDTRWSALTWLPPQRRAGGCFSFMLLVQSPGGALTSFAGCLAGVKRPKSIRTSWLSGECQPPSWPRSQDFLPTTPYTFSSRVNSYLCLSCRIVYFDKKNVYNTRFPDSKL